MYPIPIIVCFLSFWNNFSGDSQCVYYFLGNGHSTYFW